MKRLRILILVMAGLALTAAGPSGHDAARKGIRVLLRRLG